MTVRDLVSGICQEYNLTNYQVRTLPEKTLLNLEANATAVENAEIAIEDVDKMLSNFQLDNLHTSEFITRKLHTLMQKWMKIILTVFLLLYTFYGKIDHNLLKMEIDVRQSTLLVGGTVASWLVSSTPEQAVWVRALAGDIVLCS